MNHILTSAETVAVEAIAQAMAAWKIDAAVPAPTAQHSLLSYLRAKAPEGVEVAFDGVVTVHFGGERGTDLWLPPALHAFGRNWELYTWLHRPFRRIGTQGCDTAPASRPPSPW